MTDNNVQITEDDIRKTLETGSLPDWRTEGWTPTWIPVWVRGEKVSSTTTHLKMSRYGGGDLQCNYRDGAYLDEWSFFLARNLRYQKSQSGTRMRLVFH